MRISKKFISLLLAVLMVTALVPMAAVSANADDDTVDVDSFADLKQALENGKNANVTASITVNSVQTLDLCGKTVTMKNNQYFNVNTGAAPFTVKDSIGGGKITSNYFVFGVQNNGRFVLESGTIESTEYFPVFCPSNYAPVSFTMKGGKLVAPKGEAIRLTPRSSTFSPISIEGGEIEALYAVSSIPTDSKYVGVVNISDGKFTTESTDIFYQSSSGAINVKATGGVFNHDTTGIIGSADAALEEDGYYHLTYNPSYIYDTDTFVSAIRNGGEYYVSKDFNYTYSVAVYLGDDTIIHGQNHTIKGAQTSSSLPNLIEVQGPNNESSFTVDNLTVNGNNKFGCFYKNEASASYNVNQEINLTKVDLNNFKTDGYGVVTAYGYETVNLDGCNFIGNTTTASDGYTDLFLPTASNVTIKDCDLRGSVLAHVDGGNRPDDCKFEITGSTIGSLYLEENENPASADSCSFAITKFENSTVKEIVVENPGTTEDDLDKILCRDATTHDNQGGMYIAKDTNGSVIDKTTTLYNDYQFRKMSDEDIVGLLGNEFKLGDDFTVSNSIGALGTSNQKNFTLDLNGKTVTITNGQGHLERRGNNNELTINDSVGGGGITTTNGYSFVLNNGMKVTVNGGNIKNTVNDVFYIYSGSADINGGDFEYPEEKSVAAGYNTSGLTVYGGTFSDNVYSFITKNTDGVFNIREANGSNTTFTTAEALGYNMTQEADDTAKDWSAIPASCFKNLQMVGLQKKNAASTSTKADGNDYQTKGMRFVTLVNEGLLKSANIADYGYVVAKVSGKTQEGIGDKFANLKCDGSNGEKTISCLGSSNSLSGDYGLYDKSTTYKYVTLAVNGMRDGEQAVARFYIKTTDGKIYYADYTNDNYVVYSGMLATY